jgi:hypothetical protein
MKSGWELNKLTDELTISGFQGANEKYRGAVSTRAGVSVGGGVGVTVAVDVLVAVGRGVLVAVLVGVGVEVRVGVMVGVLVIVGLNSGVGEAAGTAPDPLSRRISRDVIINAKTINSNKPAATVQFRSGCSGDWFS